MGITLYDVVTTGVFSSQVFWEKVGTACIEVSMTLFYSVIPFSFHTLFRV
jgi:hypothetical protein